jgi:hypothetical protein
MSVTTENTTAVRAEPKRRGRRVLAVIGALVLALSGYLTWSNLHPVTLTASVEIPASADRVWAVLNDFPAYPAWNPFMISAQVTSPDGTLTAGATMRNVMHDTTGDTTFTPTVLVAEAGKRLRWIGKVGPGWMADGEHTFDIQVLGPNLVRLIQTERFTGAAIPFYAGTLRKNTLPQFEAMNRALAERVAVQP